jgi:hypothetical protein
MGIREMESNLAPEVKRAVNLICNIIKGHREISRREYYIFLERIQGAKTKIVERQVDVFYKSKAYQDKPLMYLAAMIKNYKEEEDLTLQAERKTTGSKPPSIKEEA